MPQTKRRVAFSNKQKKEQLKAKREKKNFVSTSEYDTNETFACFEEKKNISLFDKGNVPVTSRTGFTILKKTLNLLPNSSLLDEIEDIGGASTSKGNRYNLKFKKRKKGDGKGAKTHYLPIVRQPEEELEVDCNTFFPSGIDYPKRPEWKKNMSKVELDCSENRSFRLFCEDIDKTYSSSELSLYELNLETWRQLWRVTEMSDILLIIVDARYSAAQFPPYLYEHLVEKEKKGVILILNKCDLLPPSLVLAWSDYFSKNFPKLIVVPFSSFEGKEVNKSKMRRALHSSLKLIEACQKLVGNNVDFSFWRKKIEDEADTSHDLAGDAPETSVNEDPEEDLRLDRSHRLRNGVLTIGAIGHPNVGKSSLINALMGKKVVSVSKTPGHTKYFQTIFIAKNIKLCDCPGLVFPSLCQQQLQIVIGSYPIAQVRDPLSSIGFIASRIDLPSRLYLKPVDADENPGTEFPWTPHSICEAWAKKRSYFTRTKGGRLDVFRAANELLRYTLIGAKDLVICLKPLGFSTTKSSFMSDERQRGIQLVQGECARHSIDVNSEACEQEEEILDESDDEDLSEDEISSVDEASDHDSSDEISPELERELNKFALLSLPN